MNDWLDAARRDLARRGPDPMIEAQLLERVRERKALSSIAAARAPTAPAAPPPWWRRLSLGVPVALAGIVVVLLGTRFLAPVAETTAPAGPAATPFIALVAPEAIAAERAPVMVSSEVARAALADYGLPVDPSRADQPVGADFLVSRAGIVLAVRFHD